jgi:hypothetical protein
MPPTPYVNERTVNGRTHHYNAEANVLSAHLRLPLAQKVLPQTHAALPEEGGYFSQRAEKYRLESVISTISSYTHVTGNRSAKPGKGWTTLTTSVIEGLNVMEIVTADRIVGQIILEHPLEGYVPTINFLGTRFENLRIAGFPVDLEIDLNMLGPRPANDEAYTRDSGLIARVKSMLSRVGDRDLLPEASRERYNQLSSTLGSSQEDVECSLVKTATGAFPGSSSGHVIRIPDFGTIVLGKVTIHHEDFKPGTSIPKKTTVRLTMIDFHFGCAIDGDASVGTGSGNGGTVP